jgi:hypothetical protein
LALGLIVGLGSGVGYTYLQKDAYRATLGLFIQRQPDASAFSTQYYTYDGFYAQQTAAAYTDNALKLLTNDEIVTKAAKRANLPSDERSIAGLKGSILAKKEASQLIQLSIVLPKQKDAAAFSVGLAEALKDRTNQLNQEGDKRLAVDTVNTEPYVIMERPSPTLFGAAGALLGLLAATVLAAAWHYVKRHRRA